MNRASFYTEEQAILEGVVSWQELSRRYVSGTKVPFEFYVSRKLRGSELDPTRYYEKSVELYHEALDSGIKPEEARRLLPQAMYTQVFSAWLPSQLDVLYKLRCDKHAQSEIQELANAMRTLESPNEGVEC